MIEGKLLASDVNFAVRGLDLSDIPHIVDYWLKSSPEDLLRMGADASKMPTAEQFEMSLKSMLAQTQQDAEVAYLIWLVNDMPIGFSSLKNIRFGECGEIHLHMWDSSFRRKGYGAILFCLSTLNFYNEFKLKTIKCEPKASNLLPNKMFHNIGFPLVNTRMGASSELSLVCELNQYDITLNIAIQYLRNVGLTLC
ncbi:MAG: GNAT family N-acetyltransferase [Sulfuriferula sp.]|nr:GNAT family N-acetyltransferase [Sulfuriferula sp.]